VLPRLDLCAKTDASLRVLGYGFSRGNMVRNLHGGSGTMHPKAKLSPLLPCRGPVENGVGVTSHGSRSSTTARIQKVEGG